MCIVIWIIVNPLEVCGLFGARNAYGDRCHAVFVIETSHVHVLVFFLLFPPFEYLFIFLPIVRVSSEASMDKPMGNTYNIELILSFLVYDILF